MIQTKVCTKCGKELPATEEWFYIYKKNSNSLHGSCKECMKKKARERWSEYYPENKNKLYETKKIYRKNSEKYKTNSRRYRQLNREKLNKQQREYYKNNKDKILNRTREYIKNNKETHKKWVSDWAKKNKDKRAVSYQTRKAKRLSLPATLTQNQWEQIKKVFNHRCAYCGKPSEKLTQDHFIPLSNGGDYTKTNIIPACRSCNSSKHNKKPIEWYRQQDFYSSDRLNKIIGYFNANGKSFWEYGSLGVTRSREEVRNERL